MPATKILLVEDDDLLATLMVETLEAEGFNVLLATGQKQALDLLQSNDVGFAILDIHLGPHETSYPVADQLMRRRMRFVFTTGYRNEGLEGRYVGHTVLQKPFMSEELLTLVGQHVRPN